MAMPVCMQGFGAKECPGSSLRTLGIIAFGEVAIFER